MNIAIIAHDAKKELMTQFCIAYCGILSRHKLFATGTTGKKIEEATEITTQQELIKDLSLVDEDLKAEITWASTPNHLVDIVTNISWDSNNDIIVEKDNGYENQSVSKRYAGSSDFA